MDDVDDKGGISKSSQPKLLTPTATPLSRCYNTAQIDQGHLQNTMVDPVGSVGSVGSLGVSFATKLANTLHPRTLSLSRIK